MTATKEREGGEGGVGRGERRERVRGEEEEDGKGLGEGVKWEDEKGGEGREVDRKLGEGWIEGGVCKCVCVGGGLSVSSQGHKCVGHDIFMPPPLTSSPLP